MSQPRGRQSSEIPTGQPSPRLPGAIQAEVDRILAQWALQVVLDERARPPLHETRDWPDHD
jgi:hypothetical protein